MTLPEYIAWMEGFMMAAENMPGWYKNQIQMKLELLKENEKASMDTNQAILCVLRKWDGCGLPETQCG